MASRYPPFKELEASRPAFTPPVPFLKTRTLDPSFKAGQGLNSHPASERFANATEEDYRVIEMGRTAIEPSELYKLMIGGIAPRPVAMVSTIGPKGVANLAPISWYQMVSHDPPMVMLSFGGAGASRVKDSARNIIQSGEFTISSSSEPYAEALNFACVDCPPDVSEWTLSGLTPAPSRLVKPARIKESPFSLECTLEFSHNISNDQGVHTTTMVVGRVKVLYVREDVLDPATGTIDPSKSLPVSRFGGLLYSRSTEGYELQRPVWDQIRDREDVRAVLERERESAKEKAEASEREGGGGEGEGEGEGGREG